MSAERQHPHVIPTPAAVEQATEERALDRALENAAREIADSLRREERDQKQEKVLKSWIPLFVVALIAIVVGFSLPRSTRDPPAVPESPEVRAAVPLKPTHTLHLPRGFEWQVELVNVGDGIIQLNSNRNLNFLGLYRSHGDRLEMYKPVDERLTEFVWEKTGENSYVLIEEPPAAKTGATYLGATLKPNSRD